MEQLQEMWTEALIDAGDAYSEAVSRSESAESTDAEGEVLYDARDNVIDLTSDNKLSDLVNGVYGSKRYNLIKEYILKELENQPITLSDGKKAIVDKSDAQHISANSGNKKVAEISHIREIIETAKFVAEETSTKDKKFDYFWYYEAQVKYGSDIFPVYINVGRAKNDATYHVYDLTQKIRETAHRVNDVERPVGNALKNDLSNNRIPQPDETVKPLDEKYLEAVEKGDSKAAQDMVEQAAREAGYDRRMFHETDAENIHIFDISRGDHGGTDSETPYGIFTKTSDKSIGLGSRQMALFVKAKKTLEVENREDVKNKIPDLVPYYDEISKIDTMYDALINKLEDAEFDALGEWMDAHPDADMDEIFPSSYIIEGKAADIDYPKYHEAHDEYIRIRKEWESKYNDVVIKCKEIITEYLRKNKYDSMYFRVDGGSRGRQTDSLILLDPEQVKSADPVTYDDNDNVIPISKRFDVQNEDMRYSERDYSYNELVAKGDLTGTVIDDSLQVKVKTDENGYVKIDSADIFDTVKAQCKQIKTNAPFPTYYVNVPDISRNVEITKDGVQHGYYKGLRTKKTSIPQDDMLNARVALKLPQILANSIEVNISNRSDNVDITYSHVMMGTVAIKNADGTMEYYAVRSVIEERINQNPILAEAKVVGKLHAVKAKKVGMSNAQVAKNGVALTDNDAYTYNIAQFLEDVKGVFDDTFSNDVYQKLGAQRKTTEFSKYLLHSDRDSYDEYSKQNANQIISSITYNALKFNDGSVGKIEGKAELADIIWRKLNTTDYQDREYAASELAEEVIKRVTVKADNPDKAMYADTVKAIKPYLHSFNLDGIRADIEHRYGKNEAKGIILAWGAKNVALKSLFT